MQVSSGVGSLGVGVSAARGPLVLIFLTSTQVNAFSSTGLARKNMNTG